ncbi:MAG: hypothetical protein AB8C84_12550 [Oligoflexales bacterium]
MLFKPSMYLFIAFLSFLSHLSFSNPLLVRVDRPSFRQLMVAMPLVATDKSSIELEKLAIEARQELSHFLEFSGLFQVMPLEHYKTLLPRKKLSQLPFAEEGFRTLNLQSWKDIGAEALVLAKISEDSTGPILEIRIADLYKGSSVVGKRYRLKSSPIVDSIKSFADHVLEHYTGAPGLFSSQIAFVGKSSPKADQQVYVSDVDGRNLRQMTTAPAPHISVAWSPDGKQLIYTSFESGRTELFIMDYPSGKRRKLAAFKGLNSGGSFSPDGKWVVFTGSVGGNAEIYVMPRNGTTRQQLIRGVGLDVSPVFSPDGNYIAFVSGRYGNPHIFRGTLQWDQQGARVVKDDRLTYAGWYNAGPSWSPDSQKIVFAGFDKDINRFDIFMMNSDGANLERLTIRSGDNETPSWSPNGKMVVFQSNRTNNGKLRDVKSQPQLYRMNADGSSQTLIPTGLYEAQTPSWGPQMKVFSRVAQSRFEKKRG